MSGYPIILSRMVMSDTNEYIVMVALYTTMKVSVYFVYICFMIYVHALL